MELNIKEDGDVFTIGLKGDVNAYVAKPLKQSVDRIKSTECKTLVIDLAETTHIDSSGMGALIYAVNMSKNYDIKLSCVNASRDILDLFETVQLRGMLGI